jgi:hypothetical protein
MYIIHGFGGWLCVNFVTLYTPISQHNINNNTRHKNTNSNTINTTKLIITIQVNLSSHQLVIKDKSADMLRINDATSVNIRLTHDTQHNTHTL